MQKRLSKILAERGIASRRHAEELIFEGRVSVDGETIKIPQTLVDPEKSRICVSGKLLPPKEEKVYFLLNKPKGYLCTNIRPNKLSKIVLDLFSHEKKRLFTVGRLDRETTGLIIITNDGHFANRVIHPSSNVTKEYLAITKEEILAHHLVILSKGMVVEGSFVKPHKVKKIGPNKVKIVIGEGKKREVRHFLENAGLTTLELTRTRIGSLHLGSLPKGSYRNLRTEEIASFS